MALIYFFTTILIFSGLYAYSWSIQAVGILAIMHLIAIPAAYFGIRYDKRLLVLLSILLSSIWLILIIVYVILFITSSGVKTEFNNRSLHHLVLTAYSMINLAFIVLLSINIINETKADATKQSPKAAQQPPPGAPPSPPAVIIKPKPVTVPTQPKK
ncbi:unnamed protein product [Medioppia subpectinata]|uniref:Uncharacterized protein n=1 Tax=Medioppia subpectinata TaxID=1979941 RepID=A0A7R9Q241_9ACAR|nr:unnamed protein product [Medioppia subpectinata]CAG2109931.1 unnamed protein product [Medioppia subpectinata]